MSKELIVVASIFLHNYNNPFGLVVVTLLLNYSWEFITHVPCTVDGCIRFPYCLSGLCWVALFCWLPTYMVQVTTLPYFQEMQSCVKQKKEKEKEKGP